MPKLPDAEKLASLVSYVTTTMCGVSFIQGDPMARGESLYLQMVMIQLQGDPDVTIVLASDTKGGRALGSKFLRISDQQLTRPMIDDTIAELLNMVAAQIKDAMGSNHTMGLPKRVTMADIIRSGMSMSDSSVLLRSEGDIDLGFWILESNSPGKADPERPRPRRSIFGK